MQLIKPCIKFLNMTKNALQMIELAGRTCYKSEELISPDSAVVFVQKLLDRKHFAMIEHATASYRVICDRGVTHEIVRHRLFSYAQESTRYCNYKGGVIFIIPPWIKISEGEYFQHTKLSMTNPSCELSWLQVLDRCEQIYIELLDNGWEPQQARSVLPNSLKTEIVITGNLREWLHFFKLQTAKVAHPQMQEVANMLLKDIRTRIGVIFDETNVLMADG